MTAVPGPLVTRDFLLLLGATFGALANYAPLLSVVPLWAEAGGADEGWVGATTGAMMAATVLTQLAMGWIFPVLTLRRMLVAGSLLLGAATLAYPLSDAITPLLLISAVRGVGFAFVVVAGAALAAQLVASSHLSRATGIYGLAAGLPSVVALPAAVWVAQTWGFLPVFVATSASALAAVPLAAAMSRGARRPARDAADRIRTWSRFLAPASVFLATAAALGGATTFLPLAEREPGIASAALLVLALTMVAARVAAGGIGARVLPGRLLLPAAALSIAGMSGLAVATGTGAGWLTVVAAAAFGAGFGAAQNDSLVVVMRRAGPGGHGTASVVWNIAYDGGMGIGAVLIGVVISAAGYEWGFAAMAIGIAVLVPTAWRMRNGAAERVSGTAESR